MGKYADARAEAIADFEARFVAEALEQSGGNARRAALENGIDRVYFHRLKRRHAQRIRDLSAPERRDLVTGDLIGSKRESDVNGGAGQSVADASQDT